MFITISLLRMESHLLYTALLVKSRSTNNCQPQCAPRASIGSENSSRCPQREPSTFSTKNSSNEKKQRVERRTTLSGFHANHACHDFFFFEQKSGGTFTMMSRRSKSEGCTSPPPPPPPPANPPPPPPSRTPPIDARP